MDIISIAILSTLSFLIALSITVALMPIVNKIGLRFNVIDIPDKRKKHKGEIVRLGGLAIYLGFLATLGIIFLISYYFPILDINHITYFKIVVSVSLFFLLGVSDDFFNMQPISRLFLQIIFATIVYLMDIKFSGLDINWFSQRENILLMNSFFSYLFTIIWIVGVTNALNWLDGLDGLAGGLSTISQIGMVIIFLSLPLPNLDLVFLCSAIIGSSIGFLRYNFFPAKILMGDGGSYLLGSMLGIISILGLRYDLQVSGQEYQILPIMSAIFLIFIPLFDMFFVMLERSINGYSVFYPDRRHFHYKFLRKGIHPRSVVILYYGLAQAFCCLAFIFFSNYLNPFFICFSLIILSFSILYCLNLRNNL